MPDPEWILRISIVAAVVCSIWGIIIRNRERIRWEQRASELHQQTRERRATSPEPMEPDWPLNPYHDRETYDDGAENGAREHRSKVFVAASTVEMKLAREQQYHSGPKNDHDF